MKISLLKIINVFKYCYQVSKNQYFSSHTVAVFLGFMSRPYLMHPKCRFGHYWPLAIILAAKCYSIFRYPLVHPLINHYQYIVVNRLFFKYAYNELDF